MKNEKISEKIKGVTPFGSSILVEMLSAGEQLGTNLAIVGKDGKPVATHGAPQGIVVAFGSKLDTKDLGLNLGDRVLLQGNYVPVPKFDDNHRDRGIVELHNIKAIFS